MMVFRTCLHVSISFVEVGVVPSPEMELFASLLVGMDLDLLL